MVYPVPTEFDDAVADGRLKHAYLVDLYVADGVGDPAPLRVWNWPDSTIYPANDTIDGTDDVTYQSMVRRMRINREIRQSATLASEPLQIVFDGSRVGDDEDIVGQFFDADWHQRLIRVRQIPMAFATNALAPSPSWEWHGRMDYRQHARSAGQERLLTLTCMGGTFRIRGRRMHTRTDADQRRRSATDAFFSGTPQMIAVPPNWARATANIPGARGVPGGRNLSRDNTFYEP